MNDEIDLVRSLGGTPVPDDAVHDRVLATVEKRLAHPPRRGSAVWGLTAAALVIAIVAGVAITHWGGANAPSVATIPSFPKGWSLKVRGGFEGIQSPTPFVNAHDMSLAQAEQKVGFQIPRPNDPLANDGQIQDVWVGIQPVEGGGTDIQIQVVYSTGVYVELGPAIPSVAGDPVAQRIRFQEEAQQDGPSTDGKARVTTVNGVPAYLVPQGAARWANGESQGGPGVVTFYLGDQVVDLVGYMSDGDLLQIAASVAPQPA
jgi:hypothetical protein